MIESSTRRDFLKASAVAASTALTAGLPGVHAAGSDVLKVGLIGCGGRGTGAAVQALNADKNVKLVALADMFKDRIDSCRQQLGREDFGEKLAVTDDKCFVGFDGYKQLIDSGVDVVLMASPPHFRPAHLKYAVEKGKHVFAEKPVAVDAPGVRSVFETIEQAKKKNLSIVSGLCWRYDPPKREVMKRIHDGAVGDIVAMQCSFNTGTLWHKDRQPNWSDMEWQLRNWLYFTWLSGDFNVEQHVHSLDKMLWAMKDQAPLRCTGTGGRQARTDPKFGHVFDHFAVVYEWANGAKCFAYCRQMANCAGDVSDHVLGTRGTCDVMRGAIVGPNEKWVYKGPRDNMYQVEHNELFASIRAGKPINNGDYMTKSSMMAIMGRMSAYTGQVVTWDQAMNSKEDLTPAKYEFGQLATPAIAIPGVTKFS